MKYLGIKCGWLVESFCVLPGVNVYWITLGKKTYWDIQFIWLFWYMTIGQIGNKLKSNGYDNY